MRLPPFTISSKPTLAPRLSQLLLSRLQQIFDHFSHRQINYARPTKLQIISDFPCVANLKGKYRLKLALNLNCNSTMILLH